MTKFAKVSFRNSERRIVKRTLEIARDDVETFAGYTVNGRGERTEKNGCEELCIARQSDIRSRVNLEMDPFYGWLVPVGQATDISASKQHLQWGPNSMSDAEVDAWRKDGVIP